MCVSVPTETVLCSVKLFLKCPENLPNIFLAIFVNASVRKIADQTNILDRPVYPGLRQVFEFSTFISHNISRMNCFRGAKWIRMPRTFVKC